MTDSTPEPVAELIEMLEATASEEGCHVFDHTPEEFGLHVMENSERILAALRTPAPALSAGAVEHEAMRLWDETSGLPEYLRPEWAELTERKRDALRVKALRAMRDGTAIASHEQARPQADLVGLLRGARDKLRWALLRLDDRTEGLSDAEDTIDKIDAALAAEQGEG